MLGTGHGNPTRAKVAFTPTTGSLGTGGTTTQTRNVIRNNQMDKDANLYSIDNIPGAPVDHLHVVGNTMRGYGNRSLGSKNDANAFNAAYAAKNYTD